MEEVVRVAPAKAPAASTELLVEAVEALAAQQGLCSMKGQRYHPGQG